MSLSRREALGTIPASAALLSRCGRSATTDRPNILFVMTDDQTAEQMSCAGNQILQTPNMDRIANEGIRFQNAFCTNSLCAPGRGSILTGCYSSVHGIRGNSEKKDAIEILNPELPTFPELLQQAGYQTALMGKYHIRQDPKGFDEWEILPGQGTYFDPEFIENGVTRKHTGYVTDIITDKTLAWLDRRDTTRPFCLLFQHKAPHRPFTPAPRHAHLWDDMEFPYPETYEDDYATRKVAALAADMKFENSLAGDYPDLPSGLSAADTKRWIFQRFVKDHYRALTGVDENLGRVLDYLDTHQLSRNTLIIYTTDNGYFLGEHGWYDKRFMYEPSLRIPLVLRYPGGCAAGQVSDQMALNIDVAPTILDYAGITLPDEMHGRSLRPLMDGSKAVKWRQSVYYAYYEDSWRMAQMSRDEMTDPTFQYFTAHRVGPHRGVRTDRYKLIEYYSEGSYWELFDLQADPHEVTNLYGQAGTEALTTQLTKELRRLQNLYGVA